MHPILANRARLWAYLLLWVPIAALIAAPALMQGCTRLESLGLALPLAVFGAGIFLSPYYLARAVRPENEPMHRLFIIWGLAAALDAASWVAIGWLAARFLAGLPGLRRLPEIATHALPYLWVFGVVLCLASAAFYYLLIAQARAREAEQERLQLQMLAREAELKALRAQLNPHFLFNSLNSISALTSLDAARAREMCVLLSDFLRRSLGLGERDSVSLREELELAKGYLAIEQIRFGRRLALDWDLDPAAEPAQVPPLLLQPLVENAIKHGISPLPEGGTVRVSTRLEDGRVRVEVGNPRDADAPRPEGLGLGLRQVRQRLQGRFGAAGRFEARVDDGRHEVILEFPCVSEAP
ncbi:MAG TPA: histidine kinase [Holophagaceae bacterium]|nr:histidine kinase [Holophagaceae bacterium]